MKTQSRRIVEGVGIATGVTIGLSILPAASQAPGQGGMCKESAFSAFLSCRTEAVSEMWLARANCMNLATPEERADCRMEALDEFLEAVEECEEQLEARREVCHLVGLGPYNPEIRPEDFVGTIDHPLYPRIPGTTFTYEKQLDDGVERVELTVTHKTKEILGVSCTIVEDVESFNGEIGEHTLDYFAQDKWGNVWYFGELSMEFEDSELESLDGSWIAGIDGAKPGIVMPAEPRLGDYFRQEFFISEAEDVFGMLSADATVDVPYGHFEHCLQTEDFSALEPGNVEHKYYAAGIGLVLEFDPGDGERLELIDIVHN